MKFLSIIWKGLVNLWDYFRPSWEGPDNKFSYKRFSQFLFMLLIARMTMNGIHDQWSFNTFLVLAVLFSLTAAIITVPELIKMVKYYSQTKKVDTYFPTGEVPPILDETIPTKTEVIKVEKAPLETIKSE